MDNTLPFDRYCRYQELSVYLKQLCDAYPQWLRLQSIGKSHEQRDIWLVTVTDFSTGAAENKPALWVDGNIHAAELAGGTACLYLLHTLVHGFGVDPSITRCLKERTFYICPRVNPDGAEWALADQPKIVRSGTRPYPFRDPSPGGLEVEDVDGDGRILMMRVPDPDGPWKIAPSEPRLMVPREPDEQGGVYFRLLPEGRVHEYDGMLLPLQEKKQQLDFNRNFPVRWREEHEQKGAGPYPTSEPEVQAMVDFIAEHNTICGGVAFHTYSGVILRPYSDQEDEKFPAEDLRTYQKLARKGTEITSYPAVSAFYEFRYHPHDVMTGAMDDWLYDHFGAYAWTVEIWSPQRQAGIGRYHFIDWYQSHGFADDVKMLRWSDRQLKGQGYVDWYAFDHPDLGRVELGGWNSLFSFWNPPGHLLETEIARFPEWLVWLNNMSPLLRFKDVRVEKVSDDLFKITAYVLNAGWLPTYVSKKALEKKKSRGVRCEIQLPAQAQLVQGEPLQWLKELEGRAYKPQSPFGWSGQTFDPTDEMCKAQWVVRAPAGTELSITARHDKAGEIVHTIALT